jgi:hypothetical protein
MKTRYWKPEEMAQLCFVEDLFDDLGLGELDGPMGRIAREKTKQHIIKELFESTFSMTDLEGDVVVYYHGYLDCLGQLCMDKLKECGFTML